ncbi:MAG: hypothetical protein V4773_00320 [Verrucomicrobiota bacterium]
MERPDPEPSGKTARPPSPPSAGFSLPQFAWTAAGVCAFAPLAGALGRAAKGSLTWPAAGSALGLAVAFIALPVGAAWLAWRWGGMRRRLRDGVFGIVLGGLAFGAVRYALHENAVRQTAIETEAQALASDLVRRPATPSTPSASSASQAKPNAIVQPIVDARRAVKARIDAVQLAYDIAAEAVVPETFFDLGSVATPEAIATRRGLMQAFAQANHLRHEAATLGAFYFSSELRDRAVSEEAVRDAVAAYRTATKNHLPRIKRLHDKDSALVLLMQQFLEFAEAQRGQWRAGGETGKFDFDSPAAGHRHADILRTAAVLATERQRLRDALK